MRAVPRAAAALLVGCVATLPLTLPTTAALAGSPPPAPIGVVDRSPRATSHLFGVTVQSTAQLPAMATLSASLGRPVDVVGFYADWTSGFPADRVTAAATAIPGGSEPEVTWEPWNHTLGASQQTYPLASIAGGRFDTYLRAWAAGAKAYGKPLMVRFAHEMNAGWYPWGLGVHGNTAASYVAAFRHVHDVFMAAGVSNVTWIWSPEAVTTATPALAALYPGSGYVDLVGIDGYNFGTGVPEGQWLSAATIFGPTLAELPSVAAGTPVLLAETGSSETGGSKAAWITAFVAYLASQPSVRGFVWSEYDGSADWPLESSAAATAAMRAALPAYQGLRAARSRAARAGGRRTAVPPPTRTAHR